MFTFDENPHFGFRTWVLRNYGTGFPPHVISPCRHIHKPGGAGSPINQQCLLGTVTVKACSDIAVDTRRSLDMLGMTEGDEAKTARHIEDPDPIGKRRHYKASTPFDQIRRLLGTDAGKAFQLIGLTTFWHEHSSHFLPPDLHIHQCYIVLA